jgi:hypothetical protein
MAARDFSLPASDHASAITERFAPAAIMKEKSDLGKNV